MAQSIERIKRIRRNMIGRCYYYNDTAYRNYGAKGITVCDEWRSSVGSFVEWAMKNGYDDSLTIDRIDSSKGYYPKNCRWITRAENTRRAANRSNHSNSTIKIHDTEIPKVVTLLNSKTIQEVANHYGVTYSCIRHIFNQNRDKIDYAKKHKRSKYVTKLIDEDLASEIAEMYSTGLFTAKEIAEGINLKQATISSIIHRMRNSGADIPSFKRNQFSKG